ncbi:MBL fold metallo-hydrolase [Saccharomonospora piscinae]|uniref:MBL fold metallo-hydrolase n=1 Tax=Saccharomonospora piscinae TaxID=687388 RepID=UPI001105DCA5|nr:MBL fold metallo-hydrolase [Saccharomonospora piscinae]TLW90715.1 MBL fold metallo-hydrolase [Saccharomonospora piscinae]
MRPLDDGARHWTEPGIYSVAPGVHRIPLPMPNSGLKAVNVYAITDGDALTLIDSGWACDEAHEALEKALSGLGAGLGDVGEFLITHVHRDHYTLALPVRREHGTPVALGAREEPALRAVATPGRPPMADQLPLLRRAGGDAVITLLTEAFAATPPPTDDTVWEQPDEWLREGRRSTVGGRTLDVLATPGHTAGHVVFADRTEGLQFTGDHVLPHITPSVGLHAAPVPLPLRDFLESLRRVRALPDARMLPAHGPTGASVHARVDELLRHHDRRLDDIAHTVSLGAHTAYEVALRLPWTRHETALSDLDPFNQALAVLEVAAHLDLLVARATLTGTDDGVLRTYRA